MGLSVGEIFLIVVAGGVAIAVGSRAVSKLPNSTNETDERDSSTDLDKQGGTRRNRHRKNKSQRR